MLAVGMTEGVHGLPGNQHCQDRCFAGTGRELQGKAKQFGVRLHVRTFDMRPERLGALTELRRNLRQPDHCFDSLDLTEEGALALEGMMAPVLQKTRCLGCHLPIVRIGQVAPAIHIGADFIDNRCRVVLLLRARKALAFVEDHFLLAARLPALLGLRHRRDELRAPSCFEDPVCWLPVEQFPMAGGIFVW